MEQFAVIAYSNWQGGKMNINNIIALRMERQHLICKAKETEYDALYRDTQPGQNVYWNGFGQPPSISYRATFDDIAYNQIRQQERRLIKGRFQGGNLGWILREDIELFAGLFMKPLKKPTELQMEILNLVQREGPMNIPLMKEMTGLLVKKITPVLSRLQQAFLIYEDQHEFIYTDMIEWDRDWYQFSEMFPDVDLDKYSRHEALKIVLQRFAYRHVLFDLEMAKSFYKLPEKDIKKAIASLVEEGVFIETDEGYLLGEDFDLLQTYHVSPPQFVYAMHRNDFLVKSNEYWLKERFTHSYPDTLYYLMIDGEFKGVVAGKFRYTPEIEDIIFDLPDEVMVSKKKEIVQAVRNLCGADSPIKRYQGKDLT